MPSFSIPLSGLSADSVALNTIGNNLANLNTTAFKEQTSAFETLFYQQLGTNGSGDRLQEGVGTQVQTTDTNFTQGSITPDGIDPHLAISGNGYFVVQQGGVQSLTRAGNFQLDNQGNLITANGESVMGYAATGGVVGAGGSLTALQLPVGTTMPAAATQNFDLATNLNAAAPAGTVFSTSVEVYDSLGQGHLMTANFTKSATQNQWTYALTLPAGDATGTVANNTGTLTFNTSGVLTTPAANGPNATFATLADGAANLSFNFNLYDGTNTPYITQTTAASQTNANNQDGYVAGTYQGFSADENGVLTASFTNGQKFAVGQVAIGSVANSEGLVAIGGNNYQTTAASGQLNAGVALTGSRGSVTGDALELSNVDISTEFANLIVAQRAFEANTKTVTTFDTVTQDTIAMIR
jgi:flagellar hook protein FlgE